MQRPPDQDDPEVALLADAARKRRVGVILAALCVGLPCAYFVGSSYAEGRRKDRLVKEQAAEWAANATEAPRLFPLVHKKLEAEEAAWREATASRDTLRPSVNSCPFPLREDRQRATYLWGVAELEGAWDYSSTKLGQAPQSHSLSQLEQFLQGYERSPERINKEEMEGMRSFSERGLSGRREVFLQAFGKEDPRAAKPVAGSFEGGFLVGRVYLYDFGTHRIACAGDVVVQSSEKVWFQSLESNAQDRAESAIQADFEQRIRRAIAAGLRDVERADGPK
jgi:hypothetical protein